MPLLARGCRKLGDGDRRRRGRRLRIDLLVGDRRESERSVGRQEDGLGAGLEHAVSPLELRAVDGEVGLVDELVGVGAVGGAAGHAERDRGADGLARGLDLEPLLGDGAADSLGDLECLLRRRLRQDDGELLAAEARRNVGVAELALEDARDAVQNGVAGEVAVGVVDVAQQVEVGHDHRQRRPRPLGPVELLAERSGEVAGVEESGLRVDAGLLLEGRNAQRAVDQQQRRHRHRQEQRVPVPEPGEGDAQHGEDEVRRETLHGEEPCAPERVPPREVQHRGEERVVERNEDDRRHKPRQRELELGAEAGVAHELHRPPRRQAVQRVIGDVERLDVPGVADLQPLRNAVDDAEEGDQLRRQEEHARNEEHDRRVVALVPRRDYDEELGAPRRMPPGPGKSASRWCRAKGGRTGRSPRQWRAHRWRRERPSRGAGATTGRMDPHQPAALRGRACSGPRSQAPNRIETSPRQWVIRPQSHGLNVCPGTGQGVPRSRDAWKITRKGEPRARTARGS